MSAGDDSTEAADDHNAGVSNRLTANIDDAPKRVTQLVAEHRDVTRAQLGRPLGDGTYATGAPCGEPPGDVAFDVETTVGRSLDNTLATLVDGELITPNQPFVVLATGRSLPDEVDVVRAGLSGYEGADRDAVINRLARLLAVDVDTLSDDLALFRQGDTEP